MNNIENVKWYKPVISGLNLWNPRDLIFCHRCQHIIHFIRNPMCIIWQQDKEKHTEVAWDFFTISKQAGLKEIWQGHKSAFWKCSSVKKKKKEYATFKRGKGDTLFCTCQCSPYFFIYNTSPTSLYLPWKARFVRQLCWWPGKSCLCFQNCRVRCIYESQWKSIHPVI